MRSAGDGAEPGSRWKLPAAFSRSSCVVFLVNIVRKPELPDILRPDTRGSLHAIRGKPKSKPVRQGRKRKVAALGKIPQNLRSSARRFLRERRLHEPRLAAIALSRPRPADPGGAARCFGRRTSRRGPGPKALGFSAIAAGPDSPVDLPVMPMVNNYDAVTNEWCPPAFVQMLANPATRTQSGDVSSRNTPTPSISPGSWSISNRSRNRAWPIFRISSTNSAPRCTPET